jgi:hypothetical protein
LRDRHAELLGLGAEVAVVGLGGTDAARALRQELALPFPLLVDEERTAYRAASLRKGSLLDLLRPSNFRARRRARREGYVQTGIGKDPFQLGGSFVFGPGDVDLLVRPATTFGDALPLEDLVAAVRDPAVRHPAGS